MQKKLILILSIFFIGINSIYAKERVELSACVDGDTIKIIFPEDEKIYTVRMLAVDTPESVHPTKGIEYYGKEASEYTCNLVTNAKKIEIEYDEGSDKTDKYDRLLVWVFVDGELLQKKLIENGYAKIAYLYGDYMYTEELQSIQEKTSAKGIGIWNEEALNNYKKQNDKKEENNTLTEELNNILEKIKTFSLIDYILIGILLIVIIFCGKKTIKNKAKNKLKRYFK